MRGSADIILPAKLTTSIPRIEESVRARSEEIEVELATLPELPTHNISQVVLQELARFSQQIQALMDGTDLTFHSEWNILNTQLHEAFHKHLQPIFKVDPRQVETAIHEIISLDDDSPILNRGVRTTSTKEEPQFRPLKRLANGSERHPIPPAKPINPFQIFRQNRLVVSFRDIRETLEKYSKPGSLGHVDFSVKNELCMRAVQVWKGPMEIYINHVLRMLQEHSRRVLGQVLSKWNQTELYKKAFKELEVIVNNFQCSMRQECKDTLDIEFNGAFTINKRSFDRYVEVEAKKMRAMDNPRIQMFNPRLKGIKDKDLGKDPFKIEFEVATFVKAYYLTAADRVCDHVFLLVLKNLFRRVQENIFSELEGRLMPDDQGDSKSLTQRVLFCMAY